MRENLPDELHDAAQQLAVLLSAQQRHIVFAESCTAGLVSAALAGVPGVSQWHCGSAVTYRETTKTAWLSVPPELIEQKNVVSSEVAAAMAEGVLHLTPEAGVAASVTGHLGPDAPADLDGVIYIAVARREGDEIAVLATHRSHLACRERAQRQQEAAVAVLRRVAAALT